MNTPRPKFPPKGIQPNESAVRREWSHSGVIRFRRRAGTLVRMTNWQADVTSDSASQVNASAEKCTPKPLPLWLSTRLFLYWLRGRYGLRTTASRCRNRRNAGRLLAACVDHRVEWPSQVRRTASRRKELWGE